MIFQSRYDDAYIDWQVYKSGRPCMIIKDNTTGETICTASINVDQPLQAGLIAIKDWSENEGVLDELQRLGIVGPVLYRIHSGFVEIPIVMVLKP